MTSPGSKTPGWAIVAILIGLTLLVACIALAVASSREEGGEVTPTVAI